jgi:hypothetical protein
MARCASYLFARWAVCLGASRNSIGSFAYLIIAAGGARYLRAVLVLHFFTLNWCILSMRVFQWGCDLF